MEKGRIFETLKKIAEEFGASEVELTITNKAIPNKKAKEIEVFKYEKEHKCEIKEYKKEHKGVKRNGKKRKNM
jgi:hypothetical protein